MPTESWTKPEDTNALAAHATAMIDAALVGTALDRDAYWAAVHMSYNTPYNDPPRKPAAPARPTALAAHVAAVETAPGSPPLPVAAMAARAAELRAI